MHQNTPACQICTLYLEKYQNYKAFHLSHYDGIMTSYYPKINDIFKKTGQTNPCH